MESKRKSGGITGENDIDDRSAKRRKVPSVSHHECVDLWSVPKACAFVDLGRYLELF